MSTSWVRVSGKALFWHIWRWKLINENERKERILMRDWQTFCFILIWFLDLHGIFFIWKIFWVKKKFHSNFQSTHKSLDSFQQLEQHEMNVIEFERKIINHFNSKVTHEWVERKSRVELTKKKARSDINKLFKVCESLLTATDGWLDFQGI
jgi:hypothetical protein